MVVNIFRSDTSRDAEAAPGPHQFTARIDRIAPYGIAQSSCSAATDLQLIDTDTGEVLARFDLTPQQQTVQASVRVIEFAWPIQVGVFR